MRSINFRSHDAARTKQGFIQIKGAVYKLKRHPRVTARVDFDKDKRQDKEQVKASILYYCDLVNTHRDYIFTHRL